MRGKGVPKKVRYDLSGRYLVGAAIFCVMPVVSAYYGRGDEVRFLYLFTAAVVVFVLFMGLERKRK